MPAFKDEHIIIIAPGSHTTLAQLGLPESFTPAKLRVKSRMFATATKGEFEPSKIRVKPKASVPPPSEAAPADTLQPPNSYPPAEPQTEYEEDLLSDEGATWPIEAGRIVDWPCFFALMQHVHNLLNGPFHTPILLIAQPCWTPKEHERLAQFFFEKFRCPAFALMDAASATCYAFAQPTATVIDVGLDKADVTAVSEFLADHLGKSAAVPKCGGAAMTQRLQTLLQPQGFTYDMCESLKKSAICEILPPGTPMPGKAVKPANGTAKQAAAAPVATNGQANSNASSLSEITPSEQPREAEEDNEGVLDVAQIVTGGKMNEFLARKEKEKADKAAAKKKGEGQAAQQRAARLKNSERETNVFYYEDPSFTPPNAAATAPIATETEATSPTMTAKPQLPISSTRKELTVGTERFQPHSGQYMIDLTSAIHRTILAYPEPHRRSQLWDNLLIVGNGSRVRGFKEALVATLQSRFLVSPSNATIFTSELPSTFSTPTATGTNTPQPGMSLQPRGNPLLYAATTASGQQYLPPGQQALPTSHTGHPAYPYHTSHTLATQTPMSMKTGKLPEYFPEWKDVGSEEAVFLGAQIAAKVIFNDLQGGTQKGFMSRSDYNESGPEGIHTFTF